MLVIGADSHIHAAIPVDLLQHILSSFADRTEFFIEEISKEDAPLLLAGVTCDLYGPIVGDPPVEESAVVYAKRPGRKYDSRLLDQTRYPARETDRVTVIAGPHTSAETGEEFSCYLYSVFGGPLAPQEPGDPSCKDANASWKFWVQHAISVNLLRVMDLDTYTNHVRKDGRI